MKVIRSKSSIEPEYTELLNDMMSYLQDVTVLRFGIKKALEMKEYEKVRMNVRDIQVICGHVSKMKFQE
jgi:hypothetical protein